MHAAALLRMRWRLCAADKRFRALSGSVVVQPSNGGIALNLRSTGEYTTARSFFGKERVIGVLELEDLPTYQLALAIAAVACLAAVRKRNIGTVSSCKDRFALLRRERFVAIDDCDLVHGRSRS